MSQGGHSKTPSEWTTAVTATTKSTDAKRPKVRAHLILKQSKDQFRWDSDIQIVKRSSFIPHSLPIFTYHISWQPPRSIRPFFIIFYAIFFIICRSLTAPAIKGSDFSL